MQNLLISQFCLYISIFTFKNYLFPVKANIYKKLFSRFNIYLYLVYELLLMAFCMLFAWSDTVTTEFLFINWPNKTKQTLLIICQNVVFCENSIFWWFIVYEKNVKIVDKVLVRDTSDRSLYFFVRWLVSPLITVTIVATK